MAKQTYTLNDMFALYVADLVRRNRKTVGSIESFYNNSFSLTFNAIFPMIRCIFFYNTSMLGDSAK